MYTEAHKKATLKWRETHPEEYKSQQRIYKNKENLAEKRRQKKINEKPPEMSFRKNIYIYTKKQLREIIFSIYNNVCRNSRKVFIP
jgi:hypothetical protein